MLETLTITEIWNLRTQLGISTISSWEFRERSPNHRAPSSAAPMGMKTNSPPASTRRRAASYRAPYLSRRIFPPHILPNPSPPASKASARKGRGSSPRDLRSQKALPRDSGSSPCKAREIAQWPVSSLRATKQTLLAPHTDAIRHALAMEDEGMSAQAGSAANIEAITAFIEKRKPDFKKLRRG